MSIETLENFLRELTEKGVVPGLSVAVVKGERIPWSRGFGFANLTTSTLATAQTDYLWFSMTKIATATAVLQLAEAGRLDLDAPVTDYFPDFSIVSQPVQVSVRHLLSHSSGLANPLPIRWVRPAGDPLPDTRAFVNRLLGKHRRLRFVPGERASYSNLGYLVLGEIISEVAGTSYEEYVRQAILRPIGMNGTDFVYQETDDFEAAVGYQRLRRPLTPLFRRVLPRGVVGDRQGEYVAFNPFHVNGPAYGGLVGNVEEAARLVMFHLNDGRIGEVRLLSPGSVREMRRIIPRGGKRDFGLGWFRPREAAGQRPAFVEHLGGGAGFWNVMRIYPGKSLGMIVMGNATNYDHDSICEAIVRVPWE